MRTITKAVLTEFVVILVACACSTVVLHAQTESAVALAARTEGLQRVPAEVLPFYGTFWRVRNSLPSIGAPSPCPPLDPSLPVYALPNGQFLVDDTAGPGEPRADAAEILSFITRMQGLQLSSIASFAMSSMEFVEPGGTSALEGVFTNAPETLLFDTMGSSSNGLLASWLDVRPSPVPDGMALGILIATNHPFELTRIETQVVFENPESLPDTEIEVGFFRGTNQFQCGMYLEPEYAASDVEGTVSLILTNTGNGYWLLSLDLPTYAWGTNRVLTIRTLPNSSGTMARMHFIACPDAIPGITAYASDNTTTNMVQVSLPKMRVWRRELSATRAVSYETFMTDLELTLLPGYQLGSSTDLALPWTWQTNGLRMLRVAIDMREGNGFFIMRPDACE